MGIASRELPFTLLSHQLQDIQHHPALQAAEYFIPWLQTLHLYSVSLFRHIYYKRVVSENSPREDLPGWLWIFYSQIVRVNQLSSSVEGEKGNKRVIKKINKCRGFIRLPFTVTELQLAPRWSWSCYERLELRDLVLLALFAIRRHLIHYGGLSRAGIWLGRAGLTLGDRGEGWVCRHWGQVDTGEVIWTWPRAVATPSLPSYRRLRDTGRRPGSASSFGRSPSKGGCI